MRSLSAPVALLAAAWLSGCEAGYSDSHLPSWVSATVRFEDGTAVAAVHWSVGTTPGGGQSRTMAPATAVEAAAGEGVAATVTDDNAPDAPGAARLRPGHTLYASVLAASADGALVGRASSAGVFLDWTPPLWLASEQVGSPAAAIACSSILFAVAHLDLHHSAFALPVGVWLGVIAWRVGVIWPCIACHAVLNGLWSIYFIGAVKTAPPTGFYLASAVVVGAVSLVGFAASLRILSKAP